MPINPNNSSTISIFRKSLIAILLVLFVGMILRIFDLGSKSFWVDELLSIWHAQGIINLETFFSPLHGNSHPPLYFVLLKITKGLFSPERKMVSINLQMMV